MTLRVRAVSEEERRTLGQMARSRTLGAGLVRRAQIILHALEGLKAPEIGARMDLGGVTVRHWLKRFNARGLPGLEEDVRTGRPPTYSAEQRSAVINTALTPPANLDLPFASWTLDRLVACLSEQGIAMRRSRISEIFIQEGLRWRHGGGSWNDPRVRQAGRPGLRAQNGAIEQLYTAAPAGSVVICLDARQRRCRGGRKPARATRASSS
jgi:transposase